MKKHAFRKLTLTRETLHRLDPSALAKTPGALIERVPIKQPFTTLNTVQGTSCGLCSDYIYCGPSAFPCEPDTIIIAQ